MSRALGLDFGTRRIGVAMSDELMLMAHGHSYILRKDINRDIETIRDIVKEYMVTEIVVGLPINMDGTYSDKTKEAMEFADKLSKAVSVPIKTWDERLTTVQAENILLEADISRFKRKGLLDKIAAQIMLQGYLDARKKGINNA